MREAKHKRLMMAARRVPPFEAPAGFGDDVLRTIREGELAVDASASSVMDQLAALFPRLAAAALVVIVAAAAFEVFAGGDVVSQLTEASDQWLLPLDWL
jgi:hypothetical protein